MTSAMIHLAPPILRQRLTIAADRPLIYAIGDVHGCHDALLALEERIRTDAAARMAERPLILYLGDYVDRGPASRAVIEHLATADHGDGIERIALCGNHDDTFLKFIFNPHQHLRWLDYGGDATLRSYGLELADYPDREGAMDALCAALRHAVPRYHVDFLQALPITLTSGDRLFVHAGIVPGIPLANQQDHDLIWIREPFLSQGPGLPLTVIHGHTAGKEPVFGKGRICIDTTCYATGRLTALKVTPDGATLL
jgi:serine/threonine protein phosphatase 1